MYFRFGFVLALFGLIEALRKREENPLIFSFTGICKFEN